MANPFAASRKVGSWNFQHRRMTPYAVAASLRKWRLPTQQEEGTQSWQNTSDAFDTHLIDTRLSVKKAQATLVLLGLACRKSVCVCVGVEADGNSIISA